MNRLLQCFSLLLNAMFHFDSQLLVDLEVLHLQFHVSLLLCVDQIWWPRLLLLPLSLIHSRDRGARLEILQALAHHTLV